MQGKIGKLPFMTSIIAQNQPIVSASVLELYPRYAGRKGGPETCPNGNSNKNRYEKK
jgi:hypothetical protein